MKSTAPLVLAIGLLVDQRASAEPPEFCIPSLQSLLMMPLSRAGDRLEAAWTKPTGTGCKCGDSGVSCDSLTRAPSYELDEGALPWKAPSLRDTPKLGSTSQLDKDEQVALEWNAPVKVDSAKVNSVKGRSVVGDLEHLALEPTVHLAGGASASDGAKGSGVRLTGISQASGHGPRTGTKGLIKDKYSERKRSPQLQ